MSAPTLVVHRCPGCPETQEALPGATAWHYCPKREKRRTIFVPDEQTTNRNEESK